MSEESKNQPIWAIGLMSGTSLDGIDAALIKTDGITIEAFGESLTLDYTTDERTQLFACLEGKGDIPAAAHMLALRHADAVESLLGQSTIARSEVKLLGFHGQTILHAPERGITQQIGDAALLASRTGIPVVADFRSADVAAGGQGAPLVPLFHAALASHMPHPVVIVNIGGVSNITYIDGDTIIACDTGTGNALIDDWVRKHTGKPYDVNGQMAASANPNAEILSQLLAHPFFSQPAPKSLDRNSFKQFAAPLIETMSEGEGAATLTAFTAASIVKIADFLPKTPLQWCITGGGRHNPTLMQSLKKQLPNVCAVEQLGWQGDALEAQAFAFLAVRSLYGMPLSLPTTTGVSKPTTGGAYYSIG
ncbi:MAG: anhydro-N-acetylmuramic acid kinase [Alphaproteobacteria bacterium]|nr:anhydro-N-acetylmuramic acid kinase [Alphaproteobacteria bacterium]